jgi:hypothetical protein
LKKGSLKLDKILKLIELWGSEGWIEFSPHSLERINDRSIVRELIPDTIKSAEEELGDGKVNQDFVIINTFANITIAGTFEKPDKIVIKTVVDKGENFIPKRK